MLNKKNEEAQRTIDSAEQPNSLQYYFQTPENGFGSVGVSQAKEEGAMPSTPSKTEPKSE